MSTTAPPVQDRALREGRGCANEHSSDHHMRTWPLVWRRPLGYCDRMCPHGFGHPDPDDVLGLQAVGGADTAHECDGCCIAPLRAAPEQRGHREAEPAGPVTGA